MCDRLQASESVCLDSDGACLWLADQSRCVFPDRVNCSSAARISSNNNLSSGSGLGVITKATCLALNTNGSTYCRYNEQASSCVHEAGWDTIERAVYASSTTAGGLLGPSLFGAVIAPRYGYIAVLFCCCFFSLLSAVLYTIGISVDSYALWVAASVVRSVSSYSTSYFFSSIIDATFEHDEHENRSSSSSSSPAGAPSMKEAVRRFHVRVLGLSLGVWSFIVSLYLYLAAPSRTEFIITEDPALRLKLHGFNVLQFAVGVCIFAFAWWSWRCESSSSSSSSAVAAVIAAKDATEQEKKQSERNEEDTEEIGQATKPVGTNEPTVADELAVVVAKFSPEPPSDDECCSCCCCGRDDFLAYLGGVLLAPLVLNLSGIAALSVTAPTLVRDFIPDPLLAQLMLSVPMPLGALFGFYLSTIISPLAVVIVCGFATAIGPLLVSLATYADPPLFPVQERAALAFAGLIVYGFFFLSGAGTQIFGAFVNIYSGSGSPSRLRRGSMFSSMMLAGLQTAFRFGYPLVAEAIGVGATMSGYCILGVMATAALLVTQKMRDGIL